MMDEYCSLCKFYRIAGSEFNKQGFGEDTATCMRYPPKYAVSSEYSEADASDIVMWYQPTVVFDEWCGEFKRHDPA
jgi:hypothetical protein